MPEPTTLLAVVPRLLLKPKEAAESLRICPRALWSLTNRREIPVVRVGRSVRYDPRDLLVWVDAQKVSR